MSSDYYESSDEAIDAMRLGGGVIVVSSVSGNLAADVGDERFWLQEVDWPHSPHVGNWYWYGPFEQRPADRFHPVVYPSASDEAAT